jgi:hypothetical protein
MKLRQLLKEYGPGVYKQKIADWTKETKGTVPEDSMRAAIDKFDKIKKNIPTRVAAKTLTLSPKFMPQDPNRKPKIGEKPINPENPLDIMKYSWKDMEILFDSYGEKAEKSSKDFNTVEDAHIVDVKGVAKVYNSGGMYVYEGSNKESCIRINYAYKYKGVDNKIYTYNFCIGNKDAGANRYFRYRFGGETGQGALYRSFYYCIDSTQSPGMELVDGKAEFTNWYHFFVIHSFENGKFGVTDSVNVYGTGHEIDGRGNGVSWKEIGEFMIKYGKKSGQSAWDKIKGQEKIFKYIAPPEEEEVENAASNGRFNLESFLKASYEVKNAYINKRAGDPSFFTEEMFENCTTEQKNLAINSGFLPSLKNLKNKDGEVLLSLARLYAKNKFRRNITSAEADEHIDKLLPLSFIKYLDESSQEKYYKLFEQKFLRFDQIEKYFDPKITQEYVNKQTKNLDFLTPDAKKWIKTPHVAKVYNALFDMWSNWEIQNPDSKNDEELSKASSQSVNPKAFTVETWSKLSSENKKVLIDLAKHFNGKEEYAAVLYGIPFIIDGKYLILNSKNEDDHEFEICDLSGKPVVNKVYSEIAIKGNDIDDPDMALDKTVSSKDVTLDDKPFSSIMSKGLDEWTKYKFQRAAGILK